MTTNPKDKSPSTKAKGVIDPLAESMPSTKTKPEKKRVLRVLDMDEVLSYERPEGADLVGDGFIELGEVALLYGPPGSFKGFAVGELMVCGAEGGGSWLGFPVKCKFKSLWINCENGRQRLKKQFSKMQMPVDVRDYVFTTDQPDSFSLADKQLAEEIREAVITKGIGLLIIDTVSNFTEDELAKHFTAFFEALYAILRDLPVKPAVLLIHHSRKPKAEDRTGRALLNLISGHQTLQRRSRTIIYMGRPTEGFKEKRVVAVALKVSNNGEMEGDKTASQLGPEHRLDALPDFDWSEWDKSGADGEGRDSRRLDEAKALEEFRQVFPEGPISRTEAGKRLEAIAHVKRSAVSERFQKFAHWFTVSGGGLLMDLKPEFKGATARETGVTDDLDFGD
jgi:hypothetical protein